jgi:hypothetical protein
MDSEPPKLMGPLSTLSNQSTWCQFISKLQKAPSWLRQHYWWYANPLTKQTENAVDAVVLVADIQQMLQV